MTAFIKTKFKQSDNQTTILTCIKQLFHMKKKYVKCQKNIWTDISIYRVASLLKKQSIPVINRPPQNFKVVKRNSYRELGIIDFSIEKLRSNIYNQSTLPPPPPTYILCKKNLYSYSEKYEEKKIYIFVLIL